jgi:hypothetical protein
MNDGQMERHWFGLGFQLLPARTRACKHFNVVFSLSILFKEESQTQTLTINETRIRAMGSAFTSQDQPATTLEKSSLSLKLPPIEHAGCT